MIYLDICFDSTHKMICSRGVCLFYTAYVSRVRNSGNVGYRRTRKPV